MALRRGRNSARPPSLRTQPATGTSPRKFNGSVGYVRRPRPPDSRRDTLFAPGKGTSPGSVAEGRSTEVLARPAEHRRIRTAFGCRPDQWTRAEFLTRCGLGRSAARGATSLAGGLARVKNSLETPAPGRWREAQVRPRLRRKSLRPVDALVVPLGVRPTRMPRRFAPHRTPPLGRGIRAIPSQPPDSRHHVQVDGRRPLELHDGDGARPSAGQPPVAPTPFDEGTYGHLEVALALGELPHDSGTDLAVNVNALCHVVSWKSDR